jgi:hypothetical protein
MLRCGIWFALALGMLEAGVQSQGAGRPMRVELDAFSGRENPSWVLNEEQSREFIAAFDALAADDSRKPLKDGLGYRGFKITGYRDFEELTVCCGVVHGLRGGKTFRWHDKDRSVERLLLKTARTHIDEPVYKYVASEVEKG